MDPQMQGALIAGISTIGGVSIAGIINGIITSNSNKRQNQAALDRLKIEIESKEKDERRKNLAGSRLYLIDFRSTISKITVEYRMLNADIANLLDAYAATCKEAGILAQSQKEAKSTPEHTARLLEQSKKYAEQAKIISDRANDIAELSKDFANQNGQTSDKILADLIDNYISRITKKNEIIKNILSFTSNTKPGIAIPDNEEIQELFKNENELTTKINRRIEELMCGEY